MSRLSLDCGFVPLVDCAPLVVARELGFAEEEGIDLILHREPSWSAVRDKLTLGRLAAAHLLAPVPVAISIGLGGGVPAALDVLLVLSVNGNAIGASRALAGAMHAAGMPGDFMDAEGTGRALIRAAARPLRVGVPFPLSMHAELLYYWLSSLGVEAPRDLDVRTVPPPQMADAMAAKEIDVFCVGEPWGSIAVETGVAEIILPSCAIWRFAPEKVLAVRRSWIDANPEATRQLMRAVWRAARWLADPAHAIVVAEVLAREDYLDVSAEIIERALRGRLVVAPSGAERTAPQFLEFFAAAATFPWRSQAMWIASRIAARSGLDHREAAQIAAGCFRPDLYRRHLADLGADLPGASAKVEGALTEATAVPSSSGELMLGPDCFFDRLIFDPDALKSA